MKQYSRVSYSARCQIYAFLQVQMPISEIASLLGVHKSTIYREIKRNRGRFGDYDPQKAQQMAKDRYRRCRRQYSVTKKYKELVRKLLYEDLSPEQVSGRIRLEHGEGPSHQAIYNYIYYAGLKHLLRRHGKRGAGRSIQRRRAREIKYGYHISERPEAANQRSRIGDWERDTMHTRNGVQVLVCQDRKSRLIKIATIKKRTSMEVGKLTEELINSTGKEAFTVTNDNGGDFKGKHHMKLKTYFCNPLSPHERGSVENVIKSLRQYVGRKTDVEAINLAAIEKKLNNRPRKVLDYRTPYEIYYSEKVALAVLI